jgi:hypothetical protein
MRIRRLRGLPGNRPQQNRIDRRQDPLRLR